MSLAMSVNEREAFLAGLHVGVLSVTDDGHQGCALHGLRHLHATTRKRRFGRNLTPATRRL